MGHGAGKAVQSHTYSVAGASLGKPYERKVCVDAVLFKEKTVYCGGEAVAYRVAYESVMLHSFLPFEISNFMLLYHKRDKGKENSVSK
jgi:hypothetical protein